MYANRRNLYSNDEDFRAKAIKSATTFTPFNL